MCSHLLAKFDAARLNYPETLTESVQTSSFAARLHRPDFDVVLRILISELQARSQRIYKSPMLRFCLAIHLENEALLRLTLSRDGAFHETPHQSPPQH
jgi:hypothetical protein